MQYLSLLVFSLQSLLVVANPLDFQHVVGNNPKYKKQNDNVVANWFAGGNHGDKFDDSRFVTAGHHRIGKITMWCDVPNGNYEMQALQLDYRNNQLGQIDQFTGGEAHGSNRDPDWAHSWTLALDEYITTVDVWTYKARGHTRIGSLSFSSNHRNNFANCGPKTGIKATWGGNKDALLYVGGSSGRIVDSLQGYFISAESF